MGYRPLHLNTSERLTANTAGRDCFQQEIFERKKASQTTAALLANSTHPSLLSWVLHPAEQPSSQPGGPWLTSLCPCSASLLSQAGSGFLPHPGWVQLCSSGPDTVTCQLWGLWAHRYHLPCLNLSFLT